MIYSVQLSFIVSYVIFYKVFITTENDATVGQAVQNSGLITATQFNLLWEMKCIKLFKFNEVAIKARDNRNP